MESGQRRTENVKQANELFYTGLPFQFTLFSTSTLENLEKKKVQ